jgi:hypothetical protein
METLMNRTLPLARASPNAFCSSSDTALPPSEDDIKSQQTTPTRGFGVPGMLLEWVILRQVVYESDLVSFVVVLVRQAQLNRLPASNSICGMRRMHVGGGRHEEGGQQQKKSE